MGSRDILNQHADRIYKAISDIVYDDDGLENIMDTHGIEHDLRFLDEENVIFWLKPVGDLWRLDNSENIFVVKVSWE